MKRTKDRHRVNALAKSLWAFIAEDEQPFTGMDAWLGDDRNIALDYGDGVFLFSYQEPGTYEVHTLFASGARKYSSDVTRYMFTHTDCVEILTKVPQCNAKALRLAESGGFKKQFSGRDWLSGGKVWPIDFLAYRIEDWLLRDDALIPRGQAFHEELAAIEVETDHDDDNVHDRFVGACMLMIEGGQTAKALCYYNRWARFYGYQPLKLVSKEPVTVDIGTAILSLEEGRLCRPE